MPDNGRRRKKSWSKTVGGYGYSVRLLERGAGGRLSLRWWSPAKKDWEVRALGHCDRERGEVEATQLSATLLAATEASILGRLTVGQLLARYEREATPNKTPEQQDADRRRLNLWAHVLGAATSVSAVDGATLDRFVHDRREGRLVVPGHRLLGSHRSGACRGPAGHPGRKTPSCEAVVEQTCVGSSWLPRRCPTCAPPGEREREFARARRARPSARSIIADLAFLQTVFRWGEQLRTSEGKPYLPDNPIRSYKKPDQPTPRRPVASYDRFLALRPHCNLVDPQLLFGGFMDLVECLGWRESALCQLWASDVDRTRHADHYPHGRIRKRWETDKEGVEMWVPLPVEARAALDRLLELRPMLGDVWIFPAPRAFGKCWTRWHTARLLERAERATGLTPLVGGDFHPYRRKWATERKHLPARDVADAGGWKSPRTLEMCYYQPDPVTLLAVVTEPRKLRDAR